MRVEPRNDEEVEARRQRLLEACNGFKDHDEHLKNYLNPPSNAELQSELCVPYGGARDNLVSACSERFFPMFGWSWSQGEEETGMEHSGDRPEFHAHGTRGMMRRGIAVGKKLPM